MRVDGPSCINVRSAQLFVTDVSEQIRTHASLFLKQENNGLTEAIGMLK